MHGNLCTLSPSPTLAGHVKRNLIKASRLLPVLPRCSSATAGFCLGSYMADVKHLDITLKYTNQEGTALGCLAVDKDPVGLRRASAAASGTSSASAGMLFHVSRVASNQVPSSGSIAGPRSPVLHAMPKASKCPAPGASNQQPCKLKASVSSI